MDSRSPSESGRDDLLEGSRRYRVFHQAKHGRRRVLRVSLERSLPTLDREGRSIAQQLDRRRFLNNLGITVGAAAAATAVPITVPAVAQVAKPPKGNIPSAPLKFGHMTFLTGPGAVLGGPSLKGHLLSPEEINAQGGIIGKRKIENLTADENAGTDANVKELRRLKLSEKIDFFCGITASVNSAAL